MPLDHLFEDLARTWKVFRESAQCFDKSSLRFCRRWHFGRNMTGRDRRLQKSVPECNAGVL
jgi:hypothetical protein